MKTDELKLVWTLICLARNSSDEKFKSVEKIMDISLNASDEDLPKILKEFRPAMLEAQIDEAIEKALE